MKGSLVASLVVEARGALAVKAALFVEVADLVVVVDDCSAASDSTWVHGP